MRCRRMLTFMLLALVALPGAAQNRDAEPQPGISVTGTGEVFARPDTAQIEVGVATEAPEAAQALEENSAAMARLLKLLARHKIPEQDVQTRHFTVSPLYEREQAHARPRLTGYQVLHQVQVNVRQLEQLGRVLDEVVRTGANRVGGIVFGVAAPEPLLDQARRQALADAQRKARLYAQAGDLRLGEILTIHELAESRPMPMRSAAGFAAEMAVPVAPGELGFRVQVNVSYGLQER